MESAVKVRLTEEELERLARNVFGTGVKEAAELSDGWANTAYRVELVDGRRTVLKIAPPPGTAGMRYERELMRTEVEAMRLAAGTVPVPEVYGSDFSGSVIPNAYFFMEMLEGEPYNKRKDSLDAEARGDVERQLGVLNARLNGIRGERFGPFYESEPEWTTWQDVFLGMIRSVLQDGRDKRVELPFSYEEAEREIEARKSVLEEVKEPYLVHWDLWDGNVFVDGGRVTGLIDFERAFWGDPLMEFYRGRFGRTEAFLEGYGAGPMTESERKRRVLYDFYLDLILLIECTFRGYTDQGHIRWAGENLVHGWKLLLES